MVIRRQSLSARLLPRYSLTIKSPPYARLQTLQALVHSADSSKKPKWQQPKSPENGPRSWTQRFFNGHPRYSLWLTTWPTFSEESFDPANPAITTSIPSPWTAQTQYQPSPNRQHRRSPPRAWDPRPPPSTRRSTSSPAAAGSPCPPSTKPGQSGNLPPRPHPGDSSRPPRKSTLHHAATTA